MVGRLITSNDDLVTSLEGVECLMIESMYQNNSGNLRRAWLINRRAMSIAQMMRLHIHGSISARTSNFEKVLEPETKLRISAEHMWLRLVCSDRYLSLMLGLPQGSADNSFAAAKALEGCDPMERMERIQCAAGGRILQRNNADLHNMAVTHEIDKLLRDAAVSMPAKWWLAPNLTSTVGHSREAFCETLRIMNQFTYYHLLAQLHLPYILHPSVDGKYDYSKVTAMNASRDILTRFVSFRSSISGPAYCRGVDFITFIASVTLCIVHICINAPREDQDFSTSSTTCFRSFAHQRLGDRGLMELTLEIMENMAENSVGEDVVASKIAGMLSQLLTIEAATASGDSYKTMGFPDVNEASPCGGIVNGDELCIHIPYLGTIKIERNGISKLSSPNLRSLSGYPLPEEEDQGLQKSSNSAQRSTGYQTVEQVISSNLGSKRTSQPQFTSLPNSCSAHDYEVNGTEELNILESGLAADIGDWSLQGVDTALFENLIRGFIEFEDV
ncbi:hypothetical protein ABW20_dc0105377 [Dactylellina cionopaga]|nr:hypothetical protein ABW20_dc0105377 [Dactylellina cionopaga]